MVDPKNDPKKMTGSGIKSATVVLTVIGIFAVVIIGAIVVF